MRRLLQSSLVLLFLAVLASGFLTVRLAAQEAVEVKPEDASPEPTPIEEQSTARPKKKAAVEESRSGARELQRSGKSIQEMMSSDEFKAAGLDKLSSQELKNLDAWLKGYRQTTEVKATEIATAEATKKAQSHSLFSTDKVLSHVDGSFNGITGNTVIKLEDGTVWKQANKSDRFQANITDHPPVMVSHSAFGYKMRIVGTGEFYVNPVRQKAP